jgi:hypothetical protein
MDRQTVQRLIEAIETGLIANPELYTQGDQCKRGIWREMVGPALRDAREALRLSFTAEEAALLYRVFNFISNIHNQLLDAQRAGMAVLMPQDQAEMFEGIGHHGTDLLNRLRDLATRASIKELTK